MDFKDKAVGADKQADGTRDRTVQGQDLDFKQLLTSRGFQLFFVALALSCLVVLGWFG